MSLTFGFYNSLNGDRKYNAEQVSSLFDGVLQDGVFASIGQAMMVTAGTGMQVLVGTGRAWFNHTWTLNDAQMPLDIDASDLILKRIDAVVLEVNNNMAVRTNTIKVIKGTPASTESAAKPAMTNADGVFQHPLAYISVNPAASAITGGDIENVVGKDKETKFVTSICESVSIEDLFSQWTGQFTTWFDNIKAQLEGDVVTNLQRQIDENKEKVNRLDTTAMLKESKATNIESVVEDDLYVTPKYLDSFLTKKLPEKYTHLVIESGDIFNESINTLSSLDKTYNFVVSTSSEYAYRVPAFIIFIFEMSGEFDQQNANNGSFYMSISDHPIMKMSFVRNGINQHLSISNTAVLIKGNPNARSNDTWSYDSSSGSIRLGSYYEVAGYHSGDAPAYLTVSLKEPEVTNSIIFQSPDSSPFSGTARLYHLDIYFV